LSADSVFKRVPKRRRYVKAVVVFRALYIGVGERGA